MRDSYSWGVGDSEEAATVSDGGGGVSNGGSHGVLGYRGSLSVSSYGSSMSVGGYRGSMSVSGYGGSIRGLSVDSGVGDADVVLVAAGVGGGDALGVLRHSLEVAGTTVDVVGGGGQCRGGVAGVSRGSVAGVSRSGVAGDSWGSIAGVGGGSTDDAGVGYREGASEDCNL